MSAVTFRKIRADEIQPGMMVARHRSHSYKRVTATEALAVTTRIVFGETTFGNTIRPRHGVMLWVREEEGVSTVTQDLGGGRLDASE